MKPIVLIAAVPLALAACKPGDTGAANTNAGANTSAVIPDSIEVNGVTYVRAGLDKAPPAPPTPTPTSEAVSAPDSDSSAPPNTDGGGTAADHGE